MICPLCQLELKIVERQGIEIDYCPKCRGVWLDRGELDKMLERSRQADRSWSDDDDDRDDDQEHPAEKPGRSARMRSPQGYPTTPGPAQPYDPPPYDERRQHDNRRKKSSFFENLFEFWD